MTDRIEFSKKDVIAALRCEAIMQGYDREIDIPPADQCSMEIVMESGKFKLARLYW